MIIANDIGLPKYKKNPQYNQVIIVDNENKIKSSRWMKKENIAKFITKNIEEKIK